MTVMTLGTTPKYSQQVIVSNKMTNQIETHSRESPGPSRPRPTAHRPPAIPPPSTTLWFVGLLPLNSRR